MGAYRDLVAGGVSTRRAAALTGIPRATACRHTGRRAAPLRARRTPANALSAQERQEVLDVLDSATHVDAAPLQVYARLLDQGRYLCSPRTMYRILAAHDQVRERRQQARHPARSIPELHADGPGQVYTWDITKLPGPARGIHFDAYVMIDIFSRYIVGAHVHHTEDSQLAAEMIREVFGVHGIPQVVHADRGTSMTSKTVAGLLADLQVTRSHSRPHVSNDNPYSEAWFKTMKYAPVFPERFTDIDHARRFLAEFIDWYNHFHHHIGIGLHTPADVHFGLAGPKAQARADTLAAARQAHPERFGGITTAPKILDLPEHAWINQPPQEATTH
jgi:transposase InsO family protein